MARRGGGGGGGNEVILFGLLAAGLWLWTKQGPAAAGSTQEAQEWWFNPTTGELRFEPGLSAPAPGFRPASEWELERIVGQGIFTDPLIG